MVPQPTYTLLSTEVRRIARPHDVSRWLMDYKSAATTKPCGSPFLISLDSNCKNSDTFTTCSFSEIKLKISSIAFAKTDEMLISRRVRRLGIV